MKENRVLTIDNLTTTFESHKQKIQAVRGVSLHVDEGDILAIVGESGSGKSVTMKSVMGLLGENADVQADHLELLQKDLLSMSEKEKRKSRGKRRKRIVAETWKQNRQTENAAFTKKACDEIIKRYIEKH